MQIKTTMKGGFPTTRIITVKKKTMFMKTIRKTQILYIATGNVKCIKRHGDFENN